MKNKNMAKNNIIEKGSVVKKEFNYKKNECSLNFTLRVDVKQQLKDFKDLLVLALKEVDEEITKKIN